MNNTSIHLAELKAEVEHLVIGMVAKYLSDNGFDGLRYRDCCCEITNLSPGNCLAEDCQAGYRVPCDCGDHDWHIQTTKPKEELEDEDDL